MTALVGAGRRVPFLGTVISLSIGVFVMLCPSLHATDGPIKHSPGEVLLVYNSNSPVSTAIASYYQAERGVTNVLPVDCEDSALSSNTETIPLSDYTVQIATPIRRYLAGHPGINFIVLTKGIPIRIGSLDLAYIGGGLYTAYNNINLNGARSFSARVANPNSPGTIQVRLDSPTGTLLGTCTVPVTHGGQKWITRTCRLSPSTGAHTLYLVYSGGFSIEWFTFSGHPTRIEAATYSTAPGVQTETCVEGGALTGSEPQGQSPRDYQPSVDSYLAAIDYPALSGAKRAHLTGSGATGLAWVNRYYHASVPFTHAKFGGYLVTRLDGYTQSDAEALVTNALAAEQNPVNGTILLDVEPDFGVGDKTMEPLATPATDIKSEAPYDTWNADMLHMGDILEASGIPSDVAITGTFVGNQSNLLGYYSWGSNDDHYNVDAYESLSFGPGAIGDTAVSTSARSMLPVNDGGQSLITDLIAEGITGVRGYVDEPLLNAISSPTIDLTHYLAGYTLAESFYAGSPYVGWEDVNIGDPLCCPYFNAGYNLITPTQASACNGSAGGVETENCSESALDITNIQNGSYTVYNDIDLDGVTNFVARVASAGPGGNIEIHLDSASGPLIGTCAVPVTGGPQIWTTQRCSVTTTAGIHDIYLVYTGGSGYLFSLEWFSLYGQ
jgi:uncharacterized protein (TIGR03790 family)